jgi:hypothetical protein
MLYDCLQIISIDFAHSFTWQEIFKTKKQRLSTSLETQENFQSLFGNLSDSPEKEIKVSNNYEPPKLGSTTSQVSIVLPSPTEIIGGSSQVDTLGRILIDALFASLNHCYR